MSSASSAAGSILMNSGLGSSRIGDLGALGGLAGDAPLHADDDVLGVDLDVDLIDRDAGFPVADGFDGFAHQVWGDAVGGPVEVQVQVAAEFRAVWVAGFWGGEDNAQGLVDVA